jgi:hypothetical protein
VSQKRVTWQSLVPSITIRKGTVLRMNIFSSLSVAKEKICNCSDETHMLV